MLPRAASRAYNTDMTKQADLIAYLFDDHPPPPSSRLTQWMESSPRFTIFVDTYRDKVRKKIRLTPEWESFLDLLGELQVAYCLLNDRRLAVAYEPYVSAKNRSPDFAVTYRDNLVFNIEVARMRVKRDGMDNDSILNRIDFTQKEEHLQYILLNKLGQMQPGMANLLVIRTRKMLVEWIDLARFMQTVKSKAEAQDPTFYEHSGYRNPAAYYRAFLRLSGIVLWGTSTQDWVNKQARPGLGVKIVNLVSSLLSG